MFVYNSEALILLKFYVIYAVSYIYIYDIIKATENIYLNILDKIREK